MNRETFIRKQILEVVKACRQFSKSGYSTYIDYKRPTEYRERFIMSIPIDSPQFTGKDFKEYVNRLDDNIDITIETNNATDDYGEVLDVYENTIEKSSDNFWYNSILKNIFNESFNTHVKYEEYLDEMSGNVREIYSELLYKLLGSIFLFKISIIKNNLVNSDIIFNILIK